METKGALIQLNFINAVTIVVIGMVGFYLIGATAALIKTARAA